MILPKLWLHVPQFWKAAGPSSRKQIKYSSFPDPRCFRTFGSQNTLNRPLKRTKRWLDLNSQENSNYLRRQLLSSKKTTELPDHFQEICNKEGRTITWRHLRQIPSQEHALSLRIFLSAFRPLNGRDVNWNAPPTPDSAHPANPELSTGGKIVRGMSAKHQLGQWEAKRLTWLSSCMIFLITWGWIETGGKA